MPGSHSGVKCGRWRIIAQKVIFSIISPLSALQVVFLDELVCIMVEVTCSFISLQEWCLFRFKEVSRFTKLFHSNISVGQILNESKIAKKAENQKFSFMLLLYGNTARQCFMCHGYNRINGKTWRIELPITYSTLSTLTQWRASRSLKISNLIISLNTVNKHSSNHKKKNLKSWGFMILFSFHLQ